MHKQSGVAIFVLYLAQLAFGASIHYFKPKAWAKGQGRRPYQNYFHAVTGLLIIALAMFQVRAVFTVSLELRGAPAPELLLRTTLPAHGLRSDPRPSFMIHIRSGADMLTTLPDRSARPQVRTGFRTEWHLQTGRPQISNGANVFWYIWIIVSTLFGPRVPGEEEVLTDLMQLLVVVYFAGVLLLVPRQFRQEKEAMERGNDGSSTELTKQTGAHKNEPSVAASDVKNA